MKLDRISVLSVVGLAASLSWPYVTSLADETFWALNHAGYLAGLLVVVVVMLGGPALARRRVGWARGARETEKGRKGLFVRAAMPGVLTAVAAVVMSGCAFFAVFGVAWGPVTSLFALAGGAGNSYLFCRWIEVYGRGSVQRGLALTFVAYALSGVARLMLSMIGDVSTAGVAAILAGCAMMSAGCLVIMGRAGTDAVAPDVLHGRLGMDAPSGSGGSAWRIFAVPTALVACELALYGLVFGTLRTGMDEWANGSFALGLGYLLRAVVPLLLLGWLLAPRWGRRGELVVWSASLAVVFALLFLVFLGNAAMVVVSAVTLAARGLVTLLVYVRVFSLLRRCAVRPAVAYGVTRGAYEIAFIGGLALCAALRGRGLVSAEAFDIVCFVVSCMLVLLLASFTRALRTPLEGAVGEAGASTGKEDGLDGRLRILADVHALSPREIEVMRRLVRGHTKRHIADELCLSEDTIRYYTKQLYRKLDIHSRQDLLLRVEEVSER